MRSSDVISVLPAGHVPQSTSWVSIAFPLQDDPPFRACVCITRDLVWVPAPHVLLQVDQDDHEAQAQSTKIYERPWTVRLKEKLIKEMHDPRRM